MNDDRSRRLRERLAFPDRLENNDDRRPVGRLGLFAEVDEHGGSLSPPGDLRPQTPEDAARAAPEVDDPYSPGGAREGAQDRVETRLASLESSVETINDALVAVLDRLDRPTAPALGADAIATALRDQIGSVSVDLGPVLDAVREELATDGSAVSSADIERLAALVRAEFRDLTLDTTPLIEALETAGLGPGRLRALLHEAISGLRLPEPDIDRVEATVRRALADLPAPPPVDLAPVLAAIASLPQAVPPTDLQPVLDAIGRALDPAVLADAVADRIEVPVLDTDAIAKLLHEQVAPPTMDVGAIARHLSVVVTEELNRVSSSVESAVAAIDSTPSSVSIDAPVDRVTDRLAEGVQSAMLRAVEEVRHADRSADRSLLREIIEAQLAGQNGSVRGLTTQLESIRVLLAESTRRDAALADTLAGIRAILGEHRALLTSHDTSRQPLPSTVVPMADAADADVIRRTIVASHRALARQLSGLSEELSAARTRDRTLLLSSIDAAPARRTSSAELVALDQLSRDVAALRAELGSLRPD